MRPVLGAEARLPAKPPRGRYSVRLPTNTFMTIRASGQGKQSLTFYGQAFTTKTTTYGDAGVPNVNDTANVFNFDQATLDASAAAQGFPVASPNPQSTFAQAWGK